MISEVLAPVGNEKMLIAAVRTGADAVYFGADKFNARRNAENFSGESLKSAIEYAHLNNVKCYLTLNTVIKDNEFSEAFKLVKEVYGYGIDAVILQDLGLARLIHKNFPNLPLHASTQMSVHSPAALNILKNMGFCRVVPARELTKPELIALCQKAKDLCLEVEVFVHGALCMCLSGQCYFSAFLGGRSANRGLCAGTCRLPFSAKCGTGYDLSLKDLSLVSYLNELTEMGVTSFKIEGRMKRPEYVASAVTAIRQMVDTGTVEPEIYKLLEQVFSRDGFTDGYYTKNFGKNMFGIRSELDKQLTSDALSKIHCLYRNERQKIPLNLYLNVKAKEPAVLTAEADGFTVTVTGDTPEKAINIPLSSERAMATLSKLGGTCYFAKNLTADIADSVTLPVSSLNALRKSAISALNSARIKQNNEKEISVDLFKIKKSENRSIKGFFVRFADFNQFKNSTQILSELKGFSLPADILLNALKSNQTPQIKTALTNSYAELPRGNTSDEAITKILSDLRQFGITKAVCHTLSAIEIAKNLNFEIMGGFGLNLFNTHALETAENLNILNCVVSPELSISEISALGDTKKIKLFSMCYGRQPLMLTRNCPVKNGIGCKGRRDGYCLLTDRKKQSFPVICQNGFSEILNCKITDISDSLDRLKTDGGYLYFTLESPETTLKVIEDFLMGNSRNGADYTRGLFKTGVL